MEKILKINKNQQLIIGKSQCTRSRLTHLAWLLRSVTFTFPRTKFRYNLKREDNSIHYLSSIIYSCMTYSIIRPVNHMRLTNSKPQPINHLSFCFPSSFYCRSKWGMTNTSSSQWKCGSWSSLRTSLLKTEPLHKHRYAIIADEQKRHTHFAEAYQ